MSWDATPTGRRGRQQTYSDAAVQTCLSMKVLFGMALRQTTGFVESLLRLVGLGWAVPDFSTLSRRQKTLAVNIRYRGSKGPLHLLVDSTGITVEGEGEWHARKHGAPRDGSGARSTSGSTGKHWTFARSRSQGATSVTPRSCLTYSARSRKIRRSAASRQTVPTTPANATTRLPTAALMPSSRPARTPSRGRPSPPVRLRETKHHAPRDTLIERSGDDGADTAAGAASRCEEDQKTVQWTVFPTIGCTA